MSSSYYLPNRSLPVSTVPLATKAAQNDADRASRLFDKLRQILSNAEKQFAGTKGASRIVFLLLNLSPDVRFLWQDRFDQRFEALCEEYLKKGVRVEYEMVDYL